MASPVLLCLGASNENLLGFAPHGAGRNISCSALHARYRNERGRNDPARVEAAITEVTRGLDVRWWDGRADLSETPLGYKNADRIAAQIESFGLGRICGRIEPLGCIMAGDPGPARGRSGRKSLHPNSFASKSTVPIADEANRWSGRRAIKMDDDGSPGNPAVGAGKDRDRYGEGCGSRSGPGTGRAEQRCFRGIAGAGRHQSVKSRCPLSRRSSRPG